VIKPTIKTVDCWCRELLKSYEKPGVGADDVTSARTTDFENVGDQPGHACWITHQPGRYYLPHSPV
jgi:hypothetical protein